MKPIATLMKPLRSVDLNTLTDAPAAIERSDVCAVPAAAVVGEAMVAFVLADAFLEKFGGDSIDEIRAALCRDRRPPALALCGRTEPAAVADVLGRLEVGRRLIRPSFATAPTSCTPPLNLSARLPPTFSNSSTT